MTGSDDSKDVEPAWHERTSTLLGASVAAVIVLGILFLGVSCVSREFNDPPPASQYFVEPSTSGSSGRPTSGDSTTPETITSTSPPVTTDINPGDPTSTTSGTETTTSDSSSFSRTPRPTRDDDGSSTRQRPRLNETRTLYPRP